MPLSSCQRVKIGIGIGSNDRTHYWAYAMLVNAFTTAKPRYQQAKEKNAQVSEQHRARGLELLITLASPRARGWYGRWLAGCPISIAQLNQLARQVSQGDSTARAAACAAQHVGRLRGPVLCHTCRVGCVLVKGGAACARARARAAAEAVRQRGLGWKESTRHRRVPQSVTSLGRIIHELVARVIGMMAGSRLARHCRSLP